MEDMCQLTERLTEYKYSGSYEQVARAILKYSVSPLLDTINFYEQTLFSYLTGNSDMHLKNFSLIHTPGIGYMLTPAYDMVSTALVNKADKEEIALTLDARKRKIKRENFLRAFRQAHINEKSIENIFSKFEQKLPTCLEFIQQSFLPAEMKKEFRDLIRQRAKQIGLAI
jgi:serine/threonine-protein kinase HipA